MTVRPAGQQGSGQGPRADVILGRDFLVRPRGQQAARAGLQGWGGLPGQVPKARKGRNA